MIRAALHAVLVFSRGHRVGVTLAAGALAIAAIAYDAITTAIDFPEGRR